MIESAPTAPSGQELNLDRRTSKFSKKLPKAPIGKNREPIQEEIAEKWGVIKWN